MSSPSPSNKPYKSRLFNFVNRYYIKFNSQVTLKFRELGYVAKTGLQTLVLPLFWLWETRKKINKTFSSPPPSASLSDFQPSKTLLSGDKFIELVNSAMDIHPQLPSLPAKKFQGLASSLKNKHIIYILENNKVKDIIPLEKQKEVSILIDNINHQITSNQILHSSSQKNSITQFFSWFNILGKSKVAANISEEMNNLNPSSLTVSNHESLSIFYSSIISFIDSFLASVEAITFFRNNDEVIDIDNHNSHSEKITDKEKNTIYIFILIQKAIDYFFRRNRNYTTLTNNQDKNMINELPFNNHKSKVSLSKIDNQSPVNPLEIILSQSQEKIEEIIPFIQDTTEEIIIQGLSQFNNIKNSFNNKLHNLDDPFQVKVLIFAAINYFFNSKNKANNLLTNNQNNFLPTFTDVELIIIDNQIIDPWLSWEDLYGEKSLSENSLNFENKTIRKDNFTSEEIVLTNHSLNNQNQEILKQTDTKETVINQEKKTNFLEKETYFVEAIEAKVIEIKYEKHLLQFILEKLDQLILWLEEIILKIVKKIKFLFKL